MHKPEFILEHETHKILCDFKARTDHKIPATRRDLVLINKKKKKKETIIRCILLIQVATK